MTRESALRQTTLALLLACSTLAGCSRPVGLEQSVWEGDLVGPPGGITGTIAALSLSDRTHASIGIQRGLEGQRYGWRLERGDCQAPGTRVGAAAQYPVLQPGPDGRAEAEAFLSQPLDSSPYAMRVVLLPGDGSEVAAACGVLQRTH